MSPSRRIRTNRKNLEKFNNFLEGEHDKTTWPETQRGRTKFKQMVYEPTGRLAGESNKRTRKKNARGSRNFVLHAVYSILVPVPYQNDRILVSRTRGNDNVKEGGEIQEFVARRVRDMAEDKETIHAMAKRLGVSRSTLYRWMDQGYILL